jgi:uncharacterized protein (TIGR03382 family)
MRSPSIPRCGRGWTARIARRSARRCTSSLGLRDARREELAHLGATGHNSLSDVIPLATGDTNCPNGGIEIETGVDANDDGTLQASEVTTTSFVCNGDKGAKGTGCTTAGAEASFGALIALFGLALRRRRG